MRYTVTVTSTLTGIQTIWYQFMWIPLAAGLTYLAYRITTRQEQRDREAGER